MAHTPGPWVAIQGIEGDPETRNERVANGNLYWTLRAETPHYDDRYLCLTAWMSEANARLIAAAPDLLAALKALVEDFGNRPEDFLDGLRAAAAAIAKAEEAT